LQWSHPLQGDYDRVLALKEDVLRMMAQRFNLRWYAWALEAASVAYSWLGRWQEAVEEGHKVLRMGEELTDHGVVSHAAWMISWAYTAQGDLVRAVAYGELAVQKAPTPADKTWAQCPLAWAWCRAGEPRRGVEVLAQGVAIQRAAHCIWGEPLALFLGEGYWLAGEYAHATRTFEEILDIAGRCGMKFLLGSAHRFLGEIALTTNPAQVAEPLAAPHFEQSIALLQQIHAENELALAYVGYSRLLLFQGNLAQARDALTRAQTIFERLGTLGEPDRVRQALATLPSA
jgi:tetratricopeptide (TPR) repeat protein